MSVIEEAFVYYSYGVTVKAKPDPQLEDDDKKYSSYNFSFKNKGAYFLFQKEPLKEIMKLIFLEALEFLFTDGHVRLNFNPKEFIVGFKVKITPKTGSKSVTISQAYGIDARGMGEYPDGDSLRKHAIEALDSFIEGEFYKIDELLESLIPIAKEKLEKERKRIAELY